MGVLLSELLVPGWADDKKIAMTSFSESNLPCHNVEPEIYFSEAKPEILFAKTLCAQCPMKSQCLEGALARQEPCGVWGGELFDEGKVIVEKRTPGRPRLIREELQPVISLPTRIKNIPSLDLEDPLELVG